MSSRIKTYRGLLLIVGCLFVISFIFIWAQQSSFQKLLSQIDPYTQTADVYHFPSCPSSKSLYTEMFNQFTNRIASVSVPADATTNVNRDPTFLQTWPTGLDFTGLARNAAYGFTLISPRHVVTAWHLNRFGVYPGLTLTFRDGSGNEYTRTIVAVEQIGATDIALAVLDSDLPGTVAYYPVVSNSDMANYAPPAVPVLNYDQLGDYLIRKAQLPTNHGDVVPVRAYSPNSSLYPFGLEADKQDTPNALITGLYPGDSGHPSFYVIDNKLAIVSEMHYSNGSGSMLGAHISDLNQAMLDLDKDLTTPPSNTYQVTTVDMSCFSPYTPTSIQQQSFSVEQSVSSNTVVGKVAYTNANSSVHATGFTISSGNTGGAFAIDSSGQITVANLSALNNSTFNLGISMSEAWPAPDDQTDVVQGSVTINILNTVTPPPTADVTLPIVNTFTAPSTSSSITVSPITVSASDDVGVIGYLINESSTKPSSTVSGWTSMAPTSYTAASTGSHTLYAWAKDAAGNCSDSKTAVVMIASANNPPVLSAIGDKSVSENSTLTFSISATDQDGDPLTYSYSQLPIGAVFDVPTLTFSWTPSYSQAGVYPITFTVTDLHGATDSETVNVTIVNVDRSPIASAGLDQSVSLSSVISLSASASSDPDADTLTYSWSKVSGPGTVTFSNPSNLSTVITFSEVGTYVIRVSVSDGTLSSFDQTTVTVNSVANVNYSVTSSAGSNGSISPSGTVTVNSGSGQTFIVTPNSGYQVGSVIVDGSNVSLTGGTTYTFPNVTANHTISVNFSRILDTTPPSITSVTLSNVTTNSVTIYWITNEAASTQVKYGPTSTYGNNTVLNSSLVTSHIVTPANLLPNTMYHYTVISSDAAGNIGTLGDGTFSTLPVINTPPVSVAPAVISMPPAKVKTPSSFTTYTYLATKPTNQTYKLTLPSSTPSVITLIEPPSLPVFLWSYIKGQIYSFPSFIDNVFERVVIGVERTFELPSSR